MMFSYILTCVVAYDSGGIIAQPAYFKPLVPKFITAVCLAMNVQDGDDFGLATCFTEVM